MSPRDAERALALEFLAVAVLRTIHGMNENGGLLGPAQYAAMLAAFGMLSVLVMYAPTAQLAAMLGLLLVLATALRPTSRGTLGSDSAGAVGLFAKTVGTNAPSMAKGAA